MLQLAVLGDSIGYGQGAARRSDTLAARLVAELTASGTPTVARVYAVPGARSDGLAAQVRRAAAQPPDVALIVIGANDLTGLVAPARAARLLGEAVAGLRDLGAEVVVAPAPDLSALPDMPAEMRGAVQAGSALLRVAQTRAAGAAGGRVVEDAATTSARFARDPPCSPRTASTPPAPGTPSSPRLWLPRCAQRRRTRSDAPAEPAYPRRSMIGRLHHLIVDTPDPRRSAEFWAALLGSPITYDSGDFVVVAPDDHSSGLAFQRAPDHRPPSWPDPAVPQQMHLDVMVEDVATARPRVLALGASHLTGDVFADPAGHPFCLIPRPDWARPVPSQGD